MHLTHALIAAAHVLAGAAWFGAMFYSLAVLHPRARSFFGGARQFEDFITHLAAGARWKVLGGAAFIALTGIGVALAGDMGTWSRGKWICLVAKAILFVVAVSVFCHASWVLWPARTLASDAEVSRFQGRFRMVALTLLILVGLSMVIGVVSAQL
jgi:hypothetical protein